MSQVVVLEQLGLLWGGSPTARKAASTLSKDPEVAPTSAEWAMLSKQTSDEGRWRPWLLGRRSVGKSERHLDELILTKWRREGGLLTISAPNRNGMKGSRAVEGREDLAAGQSGQVVRDVQQGECVLLRDGVQLPVIHSPTYLLAALLRDLNKGERPGRVSFFYHLLSQPTVNLLPEGLFHHGIQGTMFHFDRCGPGLHSVAWEMRLVSPYPPMEITSVNCRRVQITSFRS